MKSSEIALILNEIYDGVERSKLGKIYMDEKDDKGYPKMNTLSYQSYISVLNSVFPKNIGFKFTEETK